MSFACVYGGECNGCMKCQEPHSHMLCDWCDREILCGEHYYDLDGYRVCEECMDECRKLYDGD
jgi:hypothetical protein